MSNAKEEVDISWRPINFSIYSNLFAGMAEEAADQWISENDLPIEKQVEVFFEHIVEHDGAGAVMSEYFRPFHSETSPF